MRPFPIPDWKFVDRTIQRNPPLYDGTPRCAKGYRPSLKYNSGPRDWLDLFSGVKERRLYVDGPVLRTEAEALAWWPTFQINAPNNTEGQT